MKETRNKYEIFLTVAHTENITEAARIMHYTQSGVSHAIAALERETGFAVFERTQNGVKLTSNGKRLIEPITKLVNQQRTVNELIHELNNAVVGTLRLGTFSSVSAAWIPDIIKRFLLEYPDVTIELQEGRYEEIVAWVQQGRIDCGFITKSELDGLAFTALYEDPMLVLMSPQHPLAKELNKNSVRIDEILQYPLVLPVEGDNHDIRQIFKNHRDKMNIKFLLRDDKSIISMVEKNFGITVMPELATRGYELPLQVLSLNPQFHRTIGIVSRPIDSLSIVTKTFIDWLKSNKNEQYQKLKSEAITQEE